MHDFNKSLQLSHDAEDLPIWEICYRQFFPNFKSMENYRQDGDHQRNGVDRSITLTNSKRYLIDEKVRTKDYGDIALEVWSDERRRVPGWIAKPLQCDFIAYAILPKGKAFLMPVEQLQAAWQRKAELWTTQYGLKRAYNQNARDAWVAVCCAVPFGPLFGEILQHSIADFEPIK